MAGTLCSEISPKFFHLNMYCFHLKL
uniref:Uncharacterized protein n=1 Tax=Arundo donax TaxID=35708 RepID=A0A0A9ED75_ARUDO